MTDAFALAALWLALAVLSTILANHLRVSVALVEICVGLAAGAVAEHFFGPDSLGSGVDWLRFLATTGAVVLTFLAGAELEPRVLRAKWKEVFVVGLLGFLESPFHIEYYREVPLSLRLEILVSDGVRGLKTVLKTPFC